MNQPRGINRLPIQLIISAVAVASVLLFSPSARTQSSPAVQLEARSEDIAYDRQRALSTVDYITELIPTVPQPADQAISYALVGEILWPYDQARARDYFRTAFSTINQIKGTSSEKDQHKRQQQEQEKKYQLRLQVLHRVARLDPKLERELIDQLKAPEANASPRDEPLNSQQLMELATVLVEDDPEEATNLARISLDHNVPDDFGTFLLNLRQSDPHAANQLFNAALEATAGQPVSVDALLSLLNYVFPHGVDEAGHRDSSIDSARTGQLVGALATELNEPESKLSANRRAESSPRLSLDERASLIQQHLPLFEQYAPQAVAALRNASNQLMARRTQASRQPTPARAADSASAENPTNRLDSPLLGPDRQTRDHLMAQAAISAAHQDDFQKAEQALQQIQDSQLRQEALDLVNFEIALQAIADGDFARARRYAVDISQVKQRAAVYVVVADKLASQGEPDRALFWLNEAYDFTSRLSDSQTKIWTLFRLMNAIVRLDAPRAFDVAQSIMATLNRVRRDSQMTDLTTLEQSSLQEYITHAFDQLGRADFDRALYLAMQLEAPDTRILAELAICRPALAGDTKLSER